MSSHRIAREFRGIHAWMRHPGVGITLLALALRAVGVITRQPWGDEQITARIITNYNLPDVVTAVLENQPHIPTYYVFVELWAMFTGLNPYTARWVSALASALAVYALYQLVLLDADRRTASAAAVLLAVSPVAISYGAWLRMYAFVMLASVWSWYELRCLQHTTGSWPRYLAATLAGVALHPFAFLTLASQGLWLVVSRRPDGWRRTSALVTVASSPLVVYVLVKASGVAADAVGSADQVSHLSTAPSLTRMMLTPVAMLTGRILSTWHAIAGLLLVATVAIALVHKHEDLDSLGLVWLATPIVGAALLSMLHPVYQLKYLGAVATPAACLLAGNVLTRPRLQRLLPVVLALNVALAAGYLASTMSVARYTIP